MDEIIKKLGVHDFFNVLCNGIVFIISILVTFPFVWRFYNGIDKNNNIEKYVILLVVAYIIGIILQGLGVEIDDKIIHSKEYVISTFLKKNSRIIDNRYKHKLYRKYGKTILKSKGFNYKDDFSEEQCKYIYGYCHRIVEKCGMDAKCEKLRDLIDFSRTTTINFFIASMSVFFKIVIGLLLKNPIVYICYDIVKLGVFVLIVLFYLLRTQKLMILKLEIVMATYEACIDKNIKNSNFALE